MPVWLPKQYTALLIPKESIVSIDRTLGTYLTTCFDEETVQSSVFNYKLKTRVLAPKQKQTSQKSAQSTTSAMRDHS